MITVTSMKCACEPCLCVVSTNEAVQKDGKYYCSQACASGGEVRPKGGRKSVLTERCGRAYPLDGIPPRNWKLRRKRCQPE